MLFNYSKEIGTVYYCNSNKPILHNSLPDKLHIYTDGIDIIVL